MIQLVFLLGVLLPTVITVACFVGFLVCYFRHRRRLCRRSSPSDGDASTATPDDTASSAAASGAKKRKRTSFVRQTRIYDAGSMTSSTASACCRAAVAAAFTAVESDSGGRSGSRIPLVVLVGADRKCWSSTSSNSTLGYDAAALAQRQHHAVSVGAETVVGPTLCRQCLIAQSVGGNSGRRTGSRCPLSSPTVRLWRDERKSFEREPELESDDRRRRLFDRKRSNEFFANASDDVIGGGGDIRRPRIVNNCYVDVESAPAVTPQTAAPSGESTVNEKTPAPKCSNVTSCDTRDVTNDVTRYLN